MIQEYFETSPTTEEFMKIYETDGGRKAYEDTLAVVNKHFPQYVRELEGIADGSKVSFTLVSSFIQISLYYLYVSFVVVFKSYGRYSL